MKQIIRFFFVLFFFISAFSAKGQRIESGTRSYRTGPDGAVTTTIGKSDKYRMTTGWNSDPFLEFTYYSSNTTSTNFMNFRFLPPNGYNPQEEKLYPLIVFLHGFGEAGTRANTNFNEWLITDPRRLNNDHSLLHGGRKHLDAVNRNPTNARAFPGFVLVPQNNNGWNSTYLGYIEKTINLLQKSHKIDPNRIYLHGLSNGGEYVWLLAERNPTLFAAILPMSGVRPNVSVEKIMHIPIWHFQGEVDPAPTAKLAQDYQKKLRNAGATPRYTEYANQGHGIWNRAYDEPDFFSWMLGQNKTNIHAYFGKTEVCPGDPINIKLGVSAGFQMYQWKKVVNGTETVFPEALNNEIVATEYGDYYVRFRRDTTWTAWSKPKTIKVKALTVNPQIKAQGSTNLPGLDGGTSVTLFAPEGYETYAWFKNDISMDASDNSIVVSSAGTYTLVVTEPDGCPSLASLPVVVNLNAPTTAIPVPTSLSAKANSETSIQLFWNDMADIERGYEVYRATAEAGPFSFIALTTENKITFRDENLAANTTYFYKIRAINDIGSSPASNIASATTLGDTTPPTAPGNLVKQGSTDTSINLSWVASTDNVGVVAYDIYSAGVFLASTTETTFLVDGLLPETIYNFTVKARDLAGNMSAASNQLTAVTFFDGLNYRYYSGGRWEKVADYAGWPVEKQGFINNFNIDLMLDGGVRPDTDVDYFAFDFEGYIYIKAADTYTFKVKAASGSILLINGDTIVNNDGNHGAQDRTGSVFLAAGPHQILVKHYDRVQSEVLVVSYSGADTGGVEIPVPDAALRSSIITLPAPPAAPTGLAAATISLEEINVTWTDNSADETGFEIYRSTNISGPYDIIYTTGADVGSYLDTNLQAETTYYYKVKSINNFGSSRFASPAVFELQGVAYNYYHGSWNLLPDFETLTPVKSGVNSQFNLTPKMQEDFYAFDYEGLLYIATEGSYAFYTKSDDGSKLYINNEQIVDNDGLHGTRERSGTKFLLPGYHLIRVTFFEKTGGGDFLEVKYQGSGISKRIIPASVLFVPLVSATTLPDTEAPSIPNGLAVKSLSIEAITLAWEAAVDNIGVTGYQVNLYNENPNATAANGRSLSIPDRVIETADTYVIFEALDHSRTYFFTVAAVDARSNKSAESMAVSGSTRTVGASPVNFLKFAGKYAGGRVALTWSTAGELNNDFFTVERSVNLIDFTTVGTVDGAGNSTNVLDYTFTDEKPLNGLNYYRIKQTDFSSDFAYSKVIVVNAQLDGGRFTAEVYPVPSEGSTLNLLVTLYNQNNPVNLMVTDIYGNTRYTATVAPAALQEPYNLLANQVYGKGIYILAIEQAGQRVYKKFIIQ